MSDTSHHYRPYVTPEPLTADGSPVQPDSIADIIAGMRSEIDGMLYAEDAEMLSKWLNRLEKVSALPLLTDEQMPPLPEFDHYVTLENGDDFGYWTRQTVKAHARAVEAAVRKQILGES